MKTVLNKVKEIFSTIFGKLKGFRFSKVSELFTIPLAILLLFFYNWFAMIVGLHTFTWDMMGKIFVAFLFFLIAVGFVRIVHLIVFPDLYKYFDSSYNENKEWKLLDEKERFKYSFYLHVALLLLFGLIVNGL